jgi:hypothetical protein
MRQYIGPIFLIAFGAYLLFYQLDYVSFHWEDVITYGFILIGFIMILNAFDREDRRGILGGVFFISYGAALSLMRFDVVYPDDNFGYGTFFLALALANLVFYLFKQERTQNLVWSVIYGSAGTVFMLIYFGYFHPWMVEDQLETYWPLVLILVGLVLIFKALRHRNTVSVNGA